MTLIRRGCPICGADHATCGGPSTTQPVDTLVVQEPRVSRVQRYENEKGQVFSLTPEDAEKLGGFTLVEEKAVDGPASDKAVRGPASSKERRAQSAKPAEKPNDDGATPPDPAADGAASPPAA